MRKTGAENRSESRSMGDRARMRDTRRQQLRASGSHRSPAAPRRDLGRRWTAQITLMAFLLGIGAGPAQSEAPVSSETALGQVTTSFGRGDFSINESQRTEYSQQTPRAILDWAQDIQQPAEHSLEFRQQDGFAILNRSPGQRPSEFWGRVVCDATCVFANEAGIHFGDGSSVDVGRMIAAGGQISSQDFLASRYHFTHVGGNVSNRGWMGGKSIQFLGQSVANFGQIETPDGSFMMLAGNEIWLREHDRPIVIQTALPSAATEPAIENAGTIRAERGRVRLAAGDMLAFAIRNSGEIKGAAISLEAGDGGLVEVSGEIDARDSAPGERGGKIDILGDYVTLRSGAHLDASGARGGGRIRVGGGREGDESVRSARGTFIHSDAQLRADANEEGDGGEIIVWADESAQIYGLLSAMGGPLGGLGGFAETSGRQWLDVQRAPQLKARSGRDGDHGGEWLIDPNNIRIVETCGETGPPTCLDDGLSQEQRDNPIFEFVGGPVLRPTVDDSLLAASLITETLEQGVGVTVSTATVLADPGSQNGNLTVEAEISPDDSRASPGSNAILNLIAANDLTVLKNIGVSGTQPGLPSNLELDIFLTAGDFSQIQNPLTEDQIDSQVPNFYTGTLQIGRDEIGETPSPVEIHSAGGRVSLVGVDVNLAGNSKVVTRGGTLDIFSFTGDATLSGGIDTSTDLLGDEGQALLGGRLAITTQGARVPENGSAGAKSQPRGGKLLLAGSTKTGGGATELLALAGDIEINTSLDTSTPGERGGFIWLRARRTELPPLEDGDDPAESWGGRIELAADSDLRSGGGSVTLGLDLDNDPVGAQEIFLKGRIDTTQAGSDSVGGTIRLETAGEGARVEIVNLDDPTTVEILTDGGDFESGGSGDFLFEDALLDTRKPSDPELATSRIDIRHTGNVTLGGSAAGSALLAATEIIQIAPAVALETSGDVEQEYGDLSFSGQPELTAGRIFLQAGDGIGGLDTTSTISLAQAQFHDGSLNAPTDFSLVQDADLDAAGIPSNIAGGDLSTLERFSLAAWDGEIRGLTNPAGISGPELELRLFAGNGLDITNSFVSDPGDPLGSLGIYISGAFTVDSGLAAAISEAARNLEIAAGAPGDSEAASLILRGDQLHASDSLLLVGGSGGTGDLAFEFDPADPLKPLELISDRVTLRAGDGDSVGEARLRSETLSAVSFAGSSGVQLGEFSLRQDLNIDDSALPALTSFSGGLDGVAYRLRSDGQNTGGGKITLGDAGATTLAQTHLSLHARNGIDLSDVQDGNLLLQSLDIGGLANFQFSQDLYAKLAFDDDLDSRLVLRAGLADPGLLSFEGDMVIAADEIRLVASDGEGGNLEDTASSIDLSPTSGAAPVFQRRSDSTLGGIFVYRQDAGIGQAELLDLDFGGGAPSSLAIRSDDGEIALDDFQTLPVVTARQELVLSAKRVSLSRGDGLNLVVDDVLELDPDVGSDPLQVGALQIRADEVILEATQPDPEATENLSATVLLSEEASKLKLSGFDNLEASDAIPGDFDFSTLPAEAPTRIEVVQDASIDASQLIDPATQLGASGDAALEEYLLKSWRGGIRITPERVNGADLELSLDSIDNSVDAADDGRSIQFDGTAFDLRSLIALTPLAWTVGSEGGNLEINAEERLQLQGALLNQGNLDFAGSVSLAGNQIVLSAGDDPLASRYGNPDPSDPPPSVRLRDAAGLATVELVLHSADGSPGALQIRQRGSLTDTIAESGGGTSLIPLTSQIQAFQEDRTTSTSLGHLQLESFAGNITLNETFDATGNPTLAADNILLAAGTGSDTGNIVHLGQGDGADLDFLGSGGGVFDSFLVFAPNIEFQTQGTGLIKLEDDGVFLLGATRLDSQLSLLISSPLSLDFEQEAAFAEAATGCDQGCLPDPTTQLGPTRASGIDYRIRSTQNSILLDDRLALKVTSSALTLEAFDADPEADSTADVQIEINSQRILDLSLQSLIVRALSEGADPSSPIDILLRDPLAGNTNNLTLATSGNQNYYGHVVIDGRVEMTGLGIQLAGSVEAADANVDVADELVLGVSELALFDDHVGQRSNLELLRINFDPLAAGSPAVGFGANHAAGTQTKVRADRIEIFTSSDLTADPSDATPADSILATIYKRTDDLLFEADFFTMGMGEKLSVPGPLSIVAQTRATLGDLSALEIDVDAPTIEILRRAPGEYANPDGQLHPDGGVDFVANQIDFHNGENPATLILTGSGRDPTFGIFDPRETPNWMNPYPTFEGRDDGSALASSDFNPPPPGFFILADLHPEGGSRDDPSTMFFNPATVPLPTAWDSAPWEPFNDETLARLQVDLRPPSAREYRSRLAMAAVFDDVGENLGAWDGQPLLLSDARIVGTQAAAAHALLLELFGSNNERASQVRSVLQNALDQYQHNTGARRVVGFELRRYVKNRPNSLYEAYRTLEDLDTLFALHRSLGLTRGEYRPIQARWLSAIQPDGITTEELSEAIQPSRYVRGSDVLDIFGD